jgi:cytochrome c-type biogenesis protein CcmH
MRRTACGILMLIVLGNVLAPAGLAQTPTPNEVNAVAKELWCPLCNGIRLDNCELQACIQMREVIAQKLETGESKEQIKAYFVEQYGDVVLGAPLAEGFNRLVWLLPILMAAAALGWLVYFVRSLVRRRPAPALATTPDNRQASGPEGDYMQRVDDELKRYS